MTRVISIRLEVPDGVSVRIDPPDEEDDADLPAPAWAVAPRPLPVGTMAPDGRNGSGCPVHRAPWRTVPGGISKRSGRAYAAFLACPAPGCDQRPGDSRPGA